MNSAKLYLLIRPRPKHTPRAVQSSQPCPCRARAANSSEAQVNSASGASVVMNRLVSASPGDRKYSSAPTSPTRASNRRRPARNRKTAAAQYMSTPPPRTHSGASPHTRSSARWSRPGRAAWSSSRTRARGPSRCTGLRPRTGHGRRPRWRPAATPPPAPGAAQAGRTHAARRGRTAGLDARWLEWTRSASVLRSAGARSHMAPPAGARQYHVCGSPAQPNAAARARPWRPRYAAAHDSDADRSDHGTIRASVRGPRAQGPQRRQRTSEDRKGAKDDAK